MSCSTSLSSTLGRSLLRRGATSTAAIGRPLPSWSPSSTRSAVQRSLSSTPRRWESAIPPSISAPNSASSKQPPADGSSGITATWHPADSSKAAEPLKIDQEPKLSLTFTCTAILDPPEPAASSPEAVVPPSEPAQDVMCSHRSTHTFTKQAYTKGIVLVECPGCKNRHLIADHLGWFPEVTEADGGKRVMRNIEDIMKEKGEQVKLGALRGGEGGTVEFY